MRARAMVVGIVAQRTGHRPRIAARTVGIVPTVLTAAIALTARLPTIVGIPRHEDTRLRAATAVAAEVAVITAAAEAEAPIVAAEVAEASTAVEVADIVAEAAVTTNRIP